MKKVSALVLCFCLVLSISTAFAAGTNIDGPGGVIMILFILGIIGVAFWAWLNPASVRQAKRNQKERENNTSRAISEAAAGNLGVVILSFQLGHPETKYYDGQAYHYFKSGANSAGSWTCKIQVANSCGKTIKYLTFNCVAVNAVNDPASCFIGSAINNLKGTGPINHGSTGFWEWENFVYSRDLSSLRLDSITADYMDGTSEEIKDDRIVWRN